MLDGDEWSTSCPSHLIAQKESQYPLHSKLSGPQAGWKIFENNLLLLLEPDSPVHILITILTTLSLWKHVNLKRWYPSPRLYGIKTEKNIDRDRGIKIWYENNECKIQQHITVMEQHHDLETN
jgi:hypothetical protein